MVADALGNSLDQFVAWFIEPVPKSFLIQRFTSAENMMQLSAVCHSLRVCYSALPCIVSPVAARRKQLG